MYYTKQQIQMATKLDVFLQSLSGTINTGTLRPEGAENIPLGSQVLDLCF